MKTNHSAEPDNFDYNLHIIVTRTLACLLAVAAIFAGAGCRSPLVEINRNGPLISSEIQINDSASNNEIPLLK